MDSIVAKKAFDFGIRMVKLSRYLKSRGTELSLRSQLLRSGTSIGANIEEALEAQSNKDFIAKLSISLKECRECRYWLKLLSACSDIEERHFEDIDKDAHELYRMLSSIIITSKKKG